MQKRNVDLTKVYNERVKPGLSQKEAEVMEQAIAAPPLRRFPLSGPFMAQWHLLFSPSGSHFGVASSEDEAEERLLHLCGLAKKTGEATA